MSRFIQQHVIRLHISEGGKKKKDSISETDQKLIKIMKQLFQDKYPH
jgi:hypothetical protein